MMEQSFAEYGLPPEVFEFSGQSDLETWTIRDQLKIQGWRGYDRYLSHEPELCFQRIRELADAFPTWQHRHKGRGRKPVSDRTHLIGLMLKQFLQATYRQLESYLRCFAEYFRIEHTPDANTLSLHNRSKRLGKVLKRFHTFVLMRTRSRKAIIATDATGFSNQKRVWSQTDHALRAYQDWTKTNATVEVPTLLYLNSVTDDSTVHESQTFDKVLAGIPGHIQPIRSLADKAFTGKECVEAAAWRGATPMHHVKRNARKVLKPTTTYEKMVHFAVHRPNRYRQLTRWRGLVETTFHVTKQRFGDRLKCRTKVARENEVQTKQTCHNVRMIIAREQLGGMRNY